MRFSGFIDRLMIIREREKTQSTVDTMLPPYTQNRVAVITENDKYLETILQLIDQAKESIKLDMFYIGGATGEKILSRLRKKAKQGVKVYYRGDACSGLESKEEVMPTKQRLMRLSRRLSRIFYTEHIRRDPYQVVGVNHNKMILVDNNTAMVSSKNPCQGDIDNRDVTLVMRGPAVNDLVRQFNTSWFHQTRQILAAEPGVLRPLPETIRAKMVEQACRPVVTSQFKRNSLKCMLDMIYNAQSSIQLHAFCLTNWQIIKALEQAAKRGRKVEVLLDSNKTYPLQIPNILPLYHLMKVQKSCPNLRIRLFEHQEVQNHPKPTKKLRHRYKNHNKMLIVDETRALVGSTNFTNADVWHQDNISVELNGGSNVAKLVRLFKADWVTHTVPAQKLGWLQTMAVQAMRLIYEF